jgi:hypothetical protein
MVGTSSFHVHMFHMSDGRPYSDSAHWSLLGNEYGQKTRIVGVALQLTSRRLAAKVLMTQKGPYFDVGVFVWDWRTGRRYLVSHLTYSE